jgi:small-conductance mechanosensitive channel
MTDDDKKISKIQSVSITLASILSAIINGIVGYIAVYFFKPVWEKIVKWWHGKEE